MRDLSVLVPARNEAFLRHTIEDILKNRRADTEIIVVCDGGWPVEPIPDHPDVTLVYCATPIGQRDAVNYAAHLSDATFVMKCDAHVAFAEGFDRVLIDAADELGPDVTQIPAQKNLHVYSWRCHACGVDQYQGPDRTECPACKVVGQMERIMVWQPRPGSTTTCWVFDSQPKFAYDKRGQKRQTGDLCDVMTSLGACFFLRRDRFWDLGGLDASIGSWGSLGIEVACKSWLSGGRHVCNRRTFFSHFFRVGGIGFPYPISGSQQEQARERTRQLFFRNAWPGQVLPLSWLVDKFAPIPGWHDAAGSEALQRVRNEGLAFVYARSVADRAKARRPTIADVPPVGGDREQVALRTVSASGVDVADSIGNVDVVGVREQSKVERIAAPSNAAQMVDDDPARPGPSKRDWRDEPRVHQAVCEDLSVPTNGGLAVSVGSCGGPSPATSVPVPHDNFREQPSDRFSVEMGDREKLRVSHAAASYAVAWSGSAARVQRSADPPSKSIIYYSDCRPESWILDACRRTMERSGLPIVAVTLKPIDWPAATNIVMPLERSALAMFRQILAGLEASTADVVFFCEHDCAYPEAHFHFTPPRSDRYYYNLNTWKVDAETGRAVTYETKQTSGLCANRQLLIEHYRKRIAIVERDGFSRRQGFEPGSHQRPERIDDVAAETWRSEVPIVDIRHGGNLTPSRWTQAEFRSQQNCRGWQESDAVPGWGVTRGRFREFLTEVSRELACAK